MPKFSAIPGIVPNDGAATAKVLQALKTCVETLTGAGNDRAVLKSELNSLLPVNNALSNPQVLARDWIFGRGVKGDTGVQGPQGYVIPGPEGDEGERGPRGVPGQDGAQGPQGYTIPGYGDDGERGQQGPPGQDGAQGSQGYVVPGRDGDDGDNAFFPPYVPTLYTLGSIPFYGASGVELQDNANLFWDATNKRLGVGTALPSNTLHTVSQSGVSNILKVDTTTASASTGGNSSVGLYRAGVSFFAFGGDSSANEVLDIINTRNAAIDFYTNNVFVVRIDAAGKLGVGNQSPGNMIHVRSPAGSSSIVQVDTTTASGSAGGNSAIAFTRNGVNFFTFGGDSFSNEIMDFVNVRNAAMDFYTNNAFAVRIDAAGKLGVQNSGPTHTLDVTGTINCSGALTKGSGTFQIDHPLDPMNKNLYHAFVESPRYDLIYRGRAKLVAGKATVNIDVASNMTPGTFAALTQFADVVSLCNRSSFSRVLASPVTGGGFTITCEDATSTDVIAWVVLAERADAYMMKATGTNVGVTGRMVPEQPKPAYGVTPPPDYVPPAGFMIDSARVGTVGFPIHWLELGLAPPLIPIPTRDTQT